MPDENSTGSEYKETNDPRASCLFLPPRTEGRKARHNASPQGRGLRGERLESTREQQNGPNGLRQLIQQERRHLARRFDWRGPRGSSPKESGGDAPGNTRVLCRPQTKAFNLVPRLPLVASAVDWASLALAALDSVASSPSLSRPAGRTDWTGADGVVLLTAPIDIGFLLIKSAFWRDESNSDP